MARHLPGARDWDDQMAAARADFDWNKQFDLAFDSEAAREIRTRDASTEEHFCSMCGRNWCAIRLSQEVRKTMQDQAEA